MNPLQTHNSLPCQLGSSDGPVGILLDQLGLRCRITQAGTFPASASWNRSRHDGEFCFVISGPPVCLQNEADTIQVEPGEVVFSLKKGSRRPLQLQSPQTDIRTTDTLPTNLTTPSRVLSGIILSNCLLSDLSEIVPENLIVGRPLDSNPLLRALLATAADEAESMSDGAWVVINQFLTAVFLQALRQCLSQLDQAELCWLDALRDSDIHRAVVAMLQSPQQKWTVELLAATTHLSRSTFSGKFHELTGRSPMAVLLEIRMKKACSLLTSGRSLKDVARETGYRSMPAFTFAFRRWSGMTPKAYRSEGNSHLGHSDGRFDFPSTDAGPA